MPPLKPPFQGLTHDGRLPSGVQDIRVSEVYGVGRLDHEMVSAVDYLPLFPHQPMIRMWSDNAQECLSGRQFKDVLELMPRASAVFVVWRSS